MKKILLVLLVLGFAVSTYAQQRAVLSKSMRDKAVEVQKPVKGLETAEATQMPGENYKSILSETDIGSTWYDIQTNQSMQTRVYLHDDGTLGAVWTMGPEGNPSGNDRGTGYNFYDGNNWGTAPTAAIENAAKAGWPSYTTFGENGEAYTAHDYDEGTILGTRYERGTGDWNLVIQGGPAGAVDISFPRIVTTGVDKSLIHILSTTWVAYNGQEAALLYARTSDAGASWEIENQVFDELGTNYTLEVGPDTYDWAEPNAGTMAFLVGDGWMDMVIMKSMDEGETWDKSVVWECPFPLNGSAATDTFYSPDGSHDIAIDNSGKVHVVFSLTRSLHDGTSQSYFPGVDGVVYWNEDRPAFSNDINALNPYGDPASELVEDYSLVGWSQDVDNNGSLDILDEWGYYNTGLSSQPQIIVDDMNQVFIVYASVTEGYDNGTANYRHIWARSSVNGGEWWGEFHDLTNDLINLFDECAFPSAADRSDDNIYFTYQADHTPGASENGISAEENFTRFVTIPKADLLSSIGEHNDLISASTVSQNYPNPFSGVSNVYVVLDEPADLSLEVTNLIGQIVYQTPVQHYSAGKAELTVRANGLESGVYFYTVRSGDKAVTKKMIIE
ncbi:MAG TPA: T9SS type A sorting domain-containing protein [Bacteroidales bacterium]|nr:T9SS type A sorting domain-containing protein [Bacteroidales bacterium]HRX97353.1 T9SS type A sorting domain-containing protein [Bacteroidales bacterium]